MTQISWFLCFSVLFYSTVFAPGFMPFLPQNAAFFLCVFLLSLSVLFKFWKTASVPRSMLAYSILALLGSLLLSLIFSNDFSVSFFGSYLRGMGFSQIFCSGTLFFIALTVFSKERTASLLSFAGFISLLGAIHGGYGLCQAFGFDFLELGSTINKGRFNIRPNAFSMNPDYFGAQMLLCIFPSIALAVSSYKEKRAVHSILSTISAMIQFSALIASMTRASWLGFAFGAIVFSALFAYVLRGAILRSKRIFAHSAAVLALFVVAASLVFVLVPKFKDMAGGKLSSILTFEEKNLYSKTGQTVPMHRPILWRDSLRLCIVQTMRGCLSGLGLDDFNRHFLPFASKELRQCTLKENYDIPHSLPISYFATAGIIGLLCYAFAIFSIVTATARYASKTLRSRECGLDFILFSGFSSALLGYSFNMLFFADDIVNLSLFFLYCSALVLLSKEEKSCDSSTEQDASSTSCHKLDTVHNPARSGAGSLAFKIVLMASAIVSASGIYDSSKKIAAQYYFKKGAACFSPKDGKSPDYVLADKYFEKAAGICPRETYYPFFRISTITMIMKSQLDSGNRKDAEASYGRVLELAEKIEKRAWCPDELFLKVGAAATMMGFVGDGISAVEKSLEWDKWWIQAHLLLAAQQQMCYLLQEDLEGLQKAFMHACIAADLLKYYSYTNPDCFKTALVNGLELCEIGSGNKVIISKISSLALTYAEVMPAESKDAINLLDPAEKTALKGDQESRDRVKAAKIVLSVRRGGTKPEDAEKSINALLKALPEKEKSEIIRKLPFLLKN